MEHSELLHRFISDLQIPGCIVQSSTLNWAYGELIPETHSQILKDLEKENAYLLGGVDPKLTRRATDDDVYKKNYLFLDFDIREYWKLKYANEEITDSDIKEIGIGIIHSLNTHPFLKNWRYLIFSGNGVHVYYFGDPIQVESKELWKRGMQYLLDKVEECTQMPPDKGCVNVGRISRIPGSFNLKNSKCVQVEILERQDASIDIGKIEKMGSHIQKDAKKIETIPDTISQGRRNTMLTSVAGTLRKRGMDEDTILESLKGVNSKKCNPPLPVQEVIQIAKNIAKYEPSRSSSTGKPVLVRISDVEPEDVTWLWQDRIPLGKITMLEGDPGNGKSWCSLAVASAVTLGAPLPDEDKQRNPANVLLLTAEDGIADTLRPRLDTMEADLTRMKVLTAVRNDKGEERHLSLADDLPAVEEALSEGGYNLVIIDPLNAYLGAKLDTHRDAALRSVLNPLAQLAERHKVAILCIRHLTKSGKDKAMYRGQGSIAYTAAARVVMLVGINPNDKQDRVIACIKNNLAPFPSNLSFEINEGRFLWKGESDVSVESMLGPEASSEKQNPIDEAKDFLMEALSSGAVRATKVKAEASDALISERTLKRAKAALEVETYREGGSEGFWMWRLPSDSKSANSPPVEQWHPLTPTQDDLPF